MKLLIDTNVLLDLIFKRSGYDNSIKLFKKIREKASGWKCMLKNTNAPESSGALV